MYWKEEGCLKGVFSYFSGNNYIKSLWEREGWVREKEIKMKKIEKERKRVRERESSSSVLIFVFSGNIYS